jgi:hypothetical protein
MRILLALLLFCPEVLGAFTYYRSLTIDHTKCGSSDSSSFPVLVSISDTTLKTVANGGHVQNTTTQSAPAVTMPADLIFATTSAGTTKLPWEVEFYDAVNGILIAWVQLPTVSHTANTVFYVLYGNSGITTAQNTGSYTPQNVWDANNQAVLHLPNGTTLSAYDSTSQANNGMVSLATATAGKVDGGAAFPGSTGQSIFLAASASLRILGPITIEAWAYFTSISAGENDTILESDYDNLNWGYRLELNGSKVQFDVAGTTGSSLDSTASVTTGVWYHIVGVYDRSNEYLYINGASAATPTAATGNIRGATTTDVTLGLLGHSSNRPLYGSLDEARISNSARSADWILTEYNNMNAPGNIGAAGFLTYGAEFSSGVKHRVVMVGF